MAKQSKKFKAASGRPWAPQRILIEKSLVDKIADIARIPSGGRTVQLQLDLSAMIERAEFSFNVPQIFSRKHDRNSLRAISKAASALAKALKGRTPGADRYIQAVWDIDVVPTANDFLAAMDFFAANASEAVEAAKPVRRRKGGRPEGHGKDYPYFVLVGELMQVTKTAGGTDLTLDKNYATGSLLDALVIIRDYVSPGLIPKPIKLSTLQRIKTYWTNN